VSRSGHDEVRVKNQHQLRPRLEERDEFLTNNSATHTLKNFVATTPFNIEAV
jgi:hypothetical protein